MTISTLISFNTFGENCSNQKDSNGFFWTRNLGRSQVQDYVQFSAFANDEISEKAWFLAKGIALSELEAECGKIPKSTFLFEKCQDHNNDTFIRYSTKKKECLNDNAEVNKTLTTLLKRYHEEILLHEKITLQSCINDENGCVIIANALLAKNKKEDAIRILNSSCDNGKFKACFFLSRIHLNNSYHKSKLAFLRGCKSSTHMACLQNSFKFQSNEKNYEDSLLSACDLGVGDACFKLVGVSDRYNNKNFISKSCIKGSVEGCRKLASFFLTTQEIKNYSSDFCKTGMKSYCRDNESMKYNLMDNLRDDEESIKPLEI